MKHNLKKVGIFDQKIIEVAIESFQDCNLERLSNLVSLDVIVNLDIAYV